MTAKTFEARLRFLPPSEGGRSTPALSGVRPHLKLGDILTSCIVRSGGATETFDLGIDYDVTIEIPFWDEYGKLFSSEAPIELFDGNRLIARGTWRHDHR
jgi:hypothetical protein